MTPAIMVTMLRPFMRPIRPITAAVGVAAHGGGDGTAGTGATGTAGKPDQQIATRLDQPGARSNDRARVAAYRVVLTLRSSPRSRSRKGHGAERAEESCRRIDRP